MASQYDMKEWQKAILNYITSQLQEHTEFFGITKDQASGMKPNIRFLDYACGTGNVSKVCTRTFTLVDSFGSLSYGGNHNEAKLPIVQAFSPFVTSCLGIDVSPNMVSTFNSRASDSALDTPTCHAVVGNLFDAEPYIVDDESGEKITGQEFLDDAKFKDFDVCIVGLGFHHFDNFVRCLRILSERVKKGGIVGIVDLLPQKGVSASFEMRPESID